MATLLSAFALAILAGPAAAAVAPIVASPQAVPAGDGSFTLKARVYTYGTDTRYHFEYGTSASYGTSVPMPDAEIGSQSVVDISQTVTGLAPSTAYHFRAVATNEGGAGASSDATFNTAGASLVPGGGGEAPAPPKGSTVRLRIVRVKGRRILASARGRTLYSLSVEKRGKFICTEESSCLSLWTPVLVPPGGKVTAPAGIRLGSVERPEGGRQATFRGLPLYTFVEDARKGETNGEGLKDVGTWHAVKAPKARTKKGTGPKPAPSAPY